MASTKQTQNRVKRHELFLDELCASGTCNMFAAIPRLRQEFPDLTQWDAIDILGYWMATYNKRKGDDKFDPIFDEFRRKDKRGDKPNNTTGGKK